MGGGGVASTFCSCGAFVCKPFVLFQGSEKKTSLCVEGTVVPLASKPASDGSD